VIVKVPITESDTPINYCLRLSDGSMVDNIEDLDIEFWRNLPSCADFAISESQFQSFILNPSRRLFRDGFFT